MSNPKTNIAELAVFGGPSLFTTPKSTSNLVRPEFQRFLSYSRQFFEQQQYTNDGPLVRLLEQRLAQFHQTEFCITFCNGFWGIALAMKVLARPGKSEVIMPSLTYRRMADIAAWTRLKPRFCEVEADTLALSAATARPCINDQTALILGVHPIVNCCEVAGLEALAREYQLPLLFDAVESVYESVADGKIGRFGDAECFSMHASKLINGFEGGYITTNNADLARRLAALRGFGFEGQDNITMPHGMNAKLNEVHAAMALAGLDELEEQVSRNRQRYRLYQRLLGGIPQVRLLEFDEEHPTSFKNIVVELRDDWPLTRSELLRILHAEKILARPYYAPPLHRKAMAYPHVPAVLPQTDHLAERFLLLPCGHFVDPGDIQAVVGLFGFIAANAGPIKNRLQQQAEA